MSNIAAANRTTTPEPANPWRGLVTIPSILSGIRLFGSPVLLVLAWAGWHWWCFTLFIILLLTDWLDGKLAIILKQQTTVGARLDSIADAVFYGCVLVATSLLKGEVIRQEIWWIAAAVGSYAISVIAALAKFGRLPSYHTWMAKSSWLFISIAIIILFADWSIWPLRVALTAVLLTNLEATAITFVLPQRRVNVPSVWHAHTQNRTQQQ